MTDDAQQVEAEVRASLRRAAAAITPGDRLEAILGQASSDRPPLVPVETRRWLTVLAAAAAVAACVALVWSVSAGTPQGATPPAVNPSTRVPSASSTTATTPTDEAVETSPPPGLPVTALPVYLVAHEAGDRGRLVLNRAFIPGDDSPLTDRVARAVTASIEGVKGADGIPFSAGVTVTVPSAGAAGVEIQLAGDTAQPLSQIQAAAMVYTAGAVVGRGDIPVRIMVIDPAGRTTTPDAYAGPLTRASFPTDVLASLWIDAPYPGQIVKRTGPSTATGVATVFEARVAYSVESVPANGPPREEESGFASFSGDASARAPFTIAVGSLPDGHYRLIVRAYSAMDGSLSAQRTVEFDLNFATGS